MFYCSNMIQPSTGRRRLSPSTLLLPITVILLATCTGVVRAAPDIDALCPRMLHQVFEEYVPYGNITAGNYTLDAAQDRLWPCVHSCCAKGAQCNVVFMVGVKCYHVQCISNEACLPLRHAANATTAAAAATEANSGDAESKATSSSALRMVLAHPVEGDTSWPESIKRFAAKLDRFDDRYSTDADDAGIDAEDASASAAAAAALSNNSPTDRTGQIPMMYADGGPLIYGDKQSISAEDPLQYRGGDLMYGSDPPVGDLQMIESQMYEQTLQPCFMPEASSRPGETGCDVNEVCVSVRNSAERGVCECALHYARNRMGECVLRVRTAMDDLVVEVAKQEEAESRIVPLSAIAPQQENDLAAPVVTTPSTTTTTQTPKPLTVSVLSKDVRLPEREVTLSAYTISDDISGNASQYRYQWSLISQPGGDVNGTMSDHTKDTIKLTNLSEGLYRFRVLVTAAADESRTGEAFANVTVSPQQRINRAPQVIITPDRLTVKLPTSKAILDGSTSTDDDRIVTWHWDLTQGPIGYHPQLPDLATLQLADLQAAGNYTFRLTLTDSDGVTNSSSAVITVLKANDYPPEANAGPDVIVYLPDTHVTLNGSLSTDDREITTWEWTKVAGVESKSVDMQNTRTPYLKLSNLQEGIYEFELRVGDASNQTSTARVHVFVKPPPANLAPKAEAGANGTVVSLPHTWVQLNGSSANDVQVKRFEWTQVSGPNQATWTDADKAQANATGLTVGAYVFRLTVWSDGGLNDTAAVKVVVVQETNEPPVANAGGDQTMAMPVKEIRLNGSRSSDDLGIVSYKWTRDGSSLAIGTVMNGTDREPVMILSNIFPGRYVFLLRVTDAQGATAVDTASVIVHPDPMLAHLVELTFAADISRWTQAEVERLQQRLLLLLGDGAALRVRDIRVDGKRSEVILVFFVEMPPPAGASPSTTTTTTTQLVPMPGREVERLLTQRFRWEPDILGMVVTDVRTTVCQNTCSDHGTCQPDTRACACDAFWMPDALWFWGMTEANCNWSILYVVIGIGVVFLCITTCCWALVRLCKRDGGVKKTLRKRAKLQKYSPLGTQDDEIPTLTQSAATLSETDTDSDIVFESSRSKSNGGSATKRKQDVESGTLRLGNGKSRNGMTRLGRKLRT